MQADPCWFDFTGTVKKICDLITEAGKNGSQLSAFSELWIPGYPTFIFSHLTKLVNDYQITYYHHSLFVDSEQMADIRRAARAAGIMVVLGIAKHHRGSSLMRQLGPDQK